ncbi:MAG: hypothetical protein Q4G21_03740 [Dermabacter sp.]|nr:hypothetical protein [Dermabacter sp.]
MALTQSKKAAKKKAKKQAKRAERTLGKVVNNAGPLFSEASKEARKKASDIYGEYGPRVEKKLRKGLADGSDRLHDLQDRLSHTLDENVSPRVKNFREDFEADYLPRARRTADATNATVAAAVTAAVDAARSEWEKGSPTIRHAALTSPVKQKKKSRAGTVLIVLGIAAVAGAAGYVAWQKTRPVEDPWAPPADFARAHYPAAGSTDADSDDVSDSVASADAGDVTGALSDDDKNTHKGDA